MNTLKDFFSWPLEIIRTVYNRITCECKNLEQYNPMICKDCGKRH